MKSHKLKLDIGCGSNKREGTIGLDIRNTGSVDVIADARMLPFKGNASTTFVQAMLLSTCATERLEVSFVSGLGF